MAKRKYYRTKKRRKQERNKKIAIVLIIMNIIIAIALIGTLKDYIKDGEAVEAQAETTTQVSSMVGSDDLIDYAPLAVEISVEDQIRQIAREENFQWEDYLVELAWCESNHNPEAKRLNNDSRKTTDRGLFQINNFWHYEVDDACAYDVDCSTRWTIEQINNGLQSMWVCNDIILNK